MEDYIKNVQKLDGGFPLLAYIDWKNENYLD